MTTIDKVAKLAGVSPATVSKVLNNRPYVSAETRALIERVIAETGFVPSQRARGLSKRRSYIFGLLIPYTPDQLFADPHLLECIRGIEDEANTHDYNMLLSTARAPAEAASACVRLMRSDVIDGAIILETLDLQPFTEVLSQHEAPMVVIGYAHTDDLHSVHADDYGGALTAMRHLLGLGHRRIGVVGSVLRPFALEERLRGVREALTERGLHLDGGLIAMGDFSLESGEIAGQMLLKQPEPPTAIFALNDRMALGVMRAARELGLSIPGDLSVIGFDDIQPAALSTPPLTTVRQPGFALGEVAARALFAQLDGAPLPQPSIISTEFIARGTTGLPRA
ncbi:MAG TPA: LacI family DNA-binding transcriptional regulator [Kouleothrix sp.]|uniref:LacI family DNA-binding transcriptional regulator n=1 Tax=Kouleothrix sp. TaxID=2779161 RepID=UPI002C6E87BF|nr:LacI family DNA-binding transcriptional regulator [Kouleothrix sp.]HRC76369.1 LacI family DNA-binding transcriptional regulator [Kouleothrix sp.]